MLGRRVRQLVEIYSAQGFRFVAPDVAFNDAQKYLPPLLKKRGKPDVDVLASLEYLRQLIEPIDCDVSSTANLKQKHESAFAGAMKMTGRYWQPHWDWVVMFGLKIRISSARASQFGQQIELRSS